MPRSKDPSVYPQEFTNIARAVGIDNQVIELTFPMSSQAFSLRNRFFAWVAAMRRVEEKVAGERKPKEQRTLEEEKWIDILQFARKTSCNAFKRPDGSGYIKFQNRDEDELSVKLREALDKAHRPATSIASKDAEKFFGKILEDLAQEGVYTPATQPSQPAESGGASSTASTAPIVPPMSQEIAPETKDRLTQYGSRNRGSGTDDQ